MEMKLQQLVNERITREKMEVRRKELLEEDYVTLTLIFKIVELGLQNGLNFHFFI